MPPRLTTFVFKIVSMLSVFMLAQSCLKSDNPGLPADVVDAIAQTGHNRVELTKTIGHFIDTDDSIYLKSAFFLIANIPQQYAVDYTIKNEKNQEIDFNPENFVSYDAIENWWNTQQIKGYRLFYEAKKFSVDKDTISAELLISTINQAVSSRSYPWAKAFTTADFFQYILPYRFENEHIYDWRTAILSDFSWIAESAKTSTKAEDVIQLINDYVNTNFVFDKRYLRVASVQTYPEIMLSRRGNQSDLAHLKASIARSFGIPATIDYTPYLADSISGFFFAVAQDSRGKFNPMLPVNSIDLFKKNKIPKVYRRIFVLNEASLFAQKNHRLKTPPYIGHYHYLDVSSDYLSVENIDFRNNTSDTLYYIGVHNDKKWRAVDWTISKDSLVSFRDMGKGINYQLLIMQNDSLVRVHTE
ncbi:MAG: transglutaminase-like domain-containing protein [Bacteroidales bacterium]|nr:transglutaminase-like domain-containing protein [Bacteroidales bacterium]